MVHAVYLSLVKFYWPKTPPDRGISVDPLMGNPENRCSFRWIPKHEQVSSCHRRRKGNWCWGLPKSSPIRVFGLHQLPQNAFREDTPTGPNPPDVFVYRTTATRSHYYPIKTRYRLANIFFVRITLLFLCPKSAFHYIWNSKFQVSIRYLNEFATSHRLESLQWKHLAKG